MLSIIAKLHSLADKLEDIYNRDDLSDKLDKIATEIFAKYKFRIHKPKKSRGISRIKRHLYYKMHRKKMQVKMHAYRKTHKTSLKRRKSLKHFHRF